MAAFALLARECKYGELVSHLAKNQPASPRWLTTGTPPMCRHQPRITSRRLAAGGTVAPGTTFRGGASRRHVDRGSGRGRVWVPYTRAAGGRAGVMGPAIKTSASLRHGGAGCRGRCGCARTRGPRVQERHELERVREAVDALRAEPDGTVVTSGSAPQTFQDMPLSSRTLRGLEQHGYVRMTPVQRETLGPLLAGRDVMATAPTGSGKTLAFVIPVLERLWRDGWTPLDGLGALVIAPTRELAFQTFDVLRRVGGAHTLSAGLVIGGKDFEQERARIAGMNILIATPGRLLQHLDQSAAFSADALQCLVLDEADRILDMGFASTLDAILEHLPRGAQRQHQTILTSATATTSVRALARLSLHRPAYIHVTQRTVGVHANLCNDTDGSTREDAPAASRQNNDPLTAGVPGDTNIAVTPQQLRQAYTVVPAERKLMVLWAFMKQHLDAKIVVFVSSCKQARFLYEVLRRLRPGFPLLHLTGKMKQPRRVAMYDQFCAHTASALVATDVAARGLDFPQVDWVLQLDCPDSVESYIHRVGRTARCDRPGRALLLLTPAEQSGFLDRLGQRGLARAVRRTDLDARRIAQHDPTSKVRSIVAADVSIKKLAQGALKSYVRCVHLQADKTVFSADAIDTLALGESFGLPDVAMPKLRLGGSGAGSGAQSKNVYGYRHSTDIATILESTHELGDGTRSARPAHLEKMSSAAAKTQSTDVEKDDDAGDNDGEPFFVVKRPDGTGKITHEPEHGEREEGDEEALVTKPTVGAATALKKVKISSKGVRRGQAVNQRVVFRDDDDDGGGFQMELATADTDSMLPILESSGQHQAYATTVAEALRAREQDIATLEKTRVREKRLKRKLQEREALKSTAAQTSNGLVLPVVDAAGFGSPSDNSLDGSGSDVDSESSLEPNLTMHEDEEQLALRVLSKRMKRST
ncbi:ATP-dependent RNA helicase dbp4 [Porphyridium purpureum]|uniref:ATP-dependent RNA helicase n=1 Tax=Porphyridium purpureum TaxID=35688 RepID=A0A5J4YSR3_PORPP|nr:ATP-dependent RNA helicase dbp4 [Porphyridium purpureum]|eukprot:POR2750..scf236_6